MSKTIILQNITTTLVNLTKRYVELSAQPDDHEQIQNYDKELSDFIQRLKEIEDIQNTLTAEELADIITLANNSIQVFQDDVSFFKTNQPLVADMILKFNDGLYKGDKGDKGDQGIQGITGVNGNTPVKGTDYVDGIDGTNGTTPVKGIDYVDGIDGTNGTTPVKGTDYVDGIDGINGTTPVKGIDYFDGIDGTNGTTPIKGTDYVDGIDGVNGTTPVKGTDYVDGIDGTNGTDGTTPVKGVDYFDGVDGADFDSSSYYSKLDIDSFNFSSHDTTILCNYPTRKYSGVITLSESLNNFEFIIVISSDSTGAYFVHQLFLTSFLKIGDIYEFWCTEIRYAMWTYTNDVTFNLASESYSWIHSIIGLGRK